MTTVAQAEARDAGPMEGVDARSLDDAGTAWDDVLSRATFAAPHYTRALIRYQRAYLRGHGTKLDDHSSVLFSDGRPVAIWPVSVAHTDAGARLGSQETHVRPPLFARGVPEPTRKRLTESCIAITRRLAERHGLTEVVTTEAARDGVVDLWHRRWMEAGAVGRVRHGLYVDLSLSEEELWSRVRRRYRTQINKGSARWKVEVVDAARPGLVDEYHALHRAAAGRETRSEETWALQDEALGAGDAFLVLLRDDTGRLVGGGLFARSQTEALYAVGAYDRSLFEHPLGHVVQWEAIRYMKRAGLSWYFVGERFYPGQLPTPTEKELDIAHFKEGFATHVLTHVELRAPAAAAPQSEDA